MPPPIVVCLLILGCGASPPAPNGVLTTAEQVRSASAGQLAVRPPVRLAGVVTHVNPLGQDFWVQDATAGVYVLPHPDAPALEQGDRVEVEGRLDPGPFAPCVAPHRVRRIGRSDLPEHPPLFDFSVAGSRAFDAQWVRAWVVVRGVHTCDGTTRVEVNTPHGCGTLVVPGEEWAPAAGLLRNAELDVRGVCVASVRGRRVAGPPHLLLASLPEVPVATSEPPVRVIDALHRFAPAPHSGSRLVKVAGVVTAVPWPGILVVQDETGGAVVWRDDPGNEIAVGTWVEASGLLRLGGNRVTLARADVRVVRPAVLPAPARVTPRELAAGSRDSQLVRMSGRVESVRAAEKWVTVVLSDGASRFEAYVPAGGRPDALRHAEEGAQVEVVGVAASASPDGTPAPTPTLYLRDAGAVTLVEPPPRPAGGPTSWWTPTRVAYLVGGFLAVALVGGAWVWTLRVRVRQSTAQIQQQYEEKARLEQQLRQAAKLEAVGRLAGGIAHDFNNLLTVINGCAELLAENPTYDPEQIAELTDDIRRAGDRAAALTGQLLTFSRKRDVPLSPVHLNDVVADAARLLNRVIGEDIRIETAFGPALPPVKAEPGLVHQVIMNLAVNARDAMPRGGTLSLRTSFLIDTGDPFASPDQPAGSAVRKYVRLEVADTGVGMSEEVRARVFEPFFTTKEVNKGTGLGLATVYGIVQSLGGKIRVDSEVGRGTTFQIDLRVHGDPASDADFAVPTTPLPVSRVAPARRLAGATVFVVEDSEMVRDMLVTGLTAEGATVLAAEGPQEALRMLGGPVGEIDVLITDVVMPGMGGRELADRVRLLRPNARVLFMSGYTADEVLRQGVLEDQVEFIQKPFTPDQLTARLLRVLGRVHS